MNLGTHPTAQKNINRGKNHTTYSKIVRFWFPHNSQRLPQLLISSTFSSPRCCLAAGVPCGCEEGGGRAPAEPTTDRGVGSGVCLRFGGTPTREMAGSWAAVRASAWPSVVAEVVRRTASWQVAVSHWRWRFFGRRWALRRTPAVGATEDCGGGCSGRWQRPKRRRPALGREKADPTEVAP